MSEPDDVDIDFGALRGDLRDMEWGVINRWNLFEQGSELECSIENAVRERNHSFWVVFLMLWIANMRTISRNWRYQNRDRKAESCVRLTVE